MTTDSVAERRAANPHAPVLGLTHSLLGRLHVTGVFWYRFAYWASTTLPLWVQRIAVFAFTGFFFCALGRIRRAVASNLEPVLGHANVWTRAKRSLRTFYVFACCLNERYLRMSQPQRFRFLLDGEEHWRRVSEGSAGAILVTAHVGPWETASRFGASGTARRVHVVREKEIDPHAQEFVRDMVARAGDNYVTHFAGDELTLALDLAQALRKGDLVLLQGDRPRTGGRSIQATLFGRPMSLPVGPAVLARAANVPMIPVFNFRDGPRLVRTVVRPPIHVPLTSDGNADVEGAMRRLAEDIEWCIRQRPYQWFCFRRLWD